MNKVGIYFAFWEKNWDADYCKYIKKVKKLGFDVLEIAAGSLPEMSKDKLRDISECAKAEGIELTYCIGLPPQYDVSSQDESIRNNGIRYVGKILNAISVMHGNLLGGIIYSCWPMKTVPSYEDKMLSRRKAILSVKELAKKAEDNGILYCLEVVNRFEQCIINTAVEGIEFINEVNSPQVRLLLDTFHMNIEEDTFRDAILTAGDKLGHFHIGERNRKVPGKGTMPWEEIMGALHDINYQGKIVMEPFIRPGGQVGKDIRIFRDLSNHATDADMDRMAGESAEFIRSKIRKEVLR